MSFSIRTYQPADFEILLALMAKFNSFIESIDDMHRTKYNPESARYFVKRMIELCQTKQGRILVGCADHTVIGFISGYVDMQDEDELMEAVPAVPGVVGEFFIDQEHRGKSYGKQLLQEMELYLQSKGCTIIRFAVFAPNTDAHEFYKHAGYRDRMTYVSKDL
ncbi:GNAT family N-acetyltransferase [Candidatus Woesebacteria bacterium]|nr:GNAT family N-acetyltransferase [Candidatus Woesebacteria bacterium]